VNKAQQEESSQNPSRGKETIEKMLDVYELRLKKPDLTLWQLGERAGIELDLMARIDNGQLLSLQQERILYGVSLSAVI
jgi:hypothetical protein